MFEDQFVENICSKQILVGDKPLIPPVGDPNQLDLFDALVELEAESMTQ